MLGITSKKFEELNIAPVQTVPNPHYKQAISFLYETAKIQSLVGSPLVEKLKPKLKIPKDYSSIFRQKYTSKNEAIEDGCRALFNLNRYTKWDKISEKNKNEIYSLKHDFIKFLYAEGYCLETYIHEQRYASYQRECRCIYDNYLQCYCDGSGVIDVPERINIYYVFKFLVAGIHYQWHQPEGVVKFKVNLSGRKELLNDSEIKPLTIAPSKFAEGKALIKWIVSN